MASSEVLSCTEAGTCFSPWVSVVVCASIAIFYVALLYIPAYILGLPPPSSLRDHMLRRIAGAVSATCLSLFLTHILFSHQIPLYSTMDIASWLDVFGLRGHHWWQAILQPLLLTSLIYLAPLVASAIELFNDLHDTFDWDALHHLKLLPYNTVAWKNYVLAPVTEEIVFRTCMTPILLCAGIQHVKIIFLCPLFFGLAHLNHFWDLVYVQHCDKKKAALIVGMQLCYTTVFGWYASFLYLRSGNILAPVIAHVYCNIMGFPELNRILQNKGLTFTLLVGVISFCLALMPLSNPLLYNYSWDICHCWSGYCKWG